MQKEPNIILLDFHLENGIGFEILKKLKTNKRTRHIPVIVLSNSDTQKSWDESYKFGADAYLVKPDHYPLLIENINHILYNEQEYNPHFFEAAMVF
jgi:CheY-like chemotaxis protein